METIMQLVLICIYGCKYPGCEHVQQEHSLPTAEAKNTRWTADEYDLIRDTMEEPLVDVALVLGRTYYTVARARVKVKRGILKT
jgi:hypothetical protein